jgi:hypothetical protein
MEFAEEAKKHWKVIAIGGVAVVGLLLFMRSSSGSTGNATSSGLDPATAAALQQQEAGQQLQASNDLASLQSQTQTTLGAQQVQATAIEAEGSNVNTANTALGQASATALASGAGQNIAAYQALSNGFSNFVVGTAGEIASAATASGTIAAANDQATAASLNATGNLLAGAGILAGSLTGSGVTRQNGLNSSGFASLANGGALLLPLNLGNGTNTSGISTSAKAGLSSFAFV